jgi:hypothetical protein
MKNIRIYNKQNELISDGNKYENENDFLNYIISSNYFGKSERWVLAKELMENGNPEEPEHWMWHSEHYEESDIIRTEMRANEETGEPEVLVLLKADYTIEIIDLDTDYDYLLSECIRKRKAEYPPVEELASALFWKEQGEPAKYDMYMKRCEEVKSKYPKPVKEIE